MITDALNPVAVETHDGITVVREDLCCDDLPSGKLRGVIPWFETLRADGVRGVINHAVSYSNSHAIVGYAAGRVGLTAVSYVNCKYPTPQTKLAESLGVRMIYSGPKQLGPLRAHAKRHDEDGFRQLPWALSHPAPYGYISDLVALIPDIETYTRHVVPIGGGGYAWAVETGIRALGLSARVVGASTSGASFAANHKRISAFNPVHHVLIRGDGIEKSETPFPSDPNYEWYAWPGALALRDAGHRVCFWSVGRPLC